jgi:hypothetical protein
MDGAGAIPLRKVRGRRARLATGFVAAAIVLLPASVVAQAVGENGYGAVRIDGANDVGAHMAFVPGPSADSWRGFVHLADLGRLWYAECSTFQCSLTLDLTATGSGDRGKFVSAARRPDGNAVAAWYDATAGDLRLTVCTSSDCVFRTERTLDTTGDVGAGTSVAVDPVSGFPVIAYYDLTNRDLKLYRCTAADCATGGALVVDSVGDVGRNPSLAIRSDGRVYIAYEDATNAGIRVATAASAAGPFNSASAAGGTNGLLQVAAAPDPPILYSVDATSRLVRRACATDTCDLGINAVLSGFAEATNPSLVVMPNGNPLISHRHFSTGAQLATVCTAPDCSTRTLVTLDAAAGAGGRSIALATAASAPYVLYRIDGQQAIASARCNATACGTVTRRIATNGTRAYSARTALRQDGRPVIIYLRDDQQGRPWLALCGDGRCTTHVKRLLPGLNSIAVPDVGIRPDGRPFAYFSSLGGTAIYSCSDADCTGGTAREVSPAGSGTSGWTSLAIRGDGRPVLLYVRRQGVDPIEFRLHVCADVDCTSGTDRLLDSIPSSTPLPQNVLHSVAVGPGDRAIALWSYSVGGVFANRYARCNDAACSGVVVSTIGNAEVSNLPLAVRADGRPVFRESTAPTMRLGTCATADCVPAGIVRVNLPFGLRGAQSMALRPGDAPVFDAALAGGIGGFDICVDATCTSSEFVAAIRDSSLPQRNFQGSVRVDPNGQPVAAWFELDLYDIWFSAPLPEAVFANGFEP